MYHDFTQRSKDKISHHLENPLHPPHLILSKHIKMFDFSPSVPSSILNVGLVRGMIKVVRNFVLPLSGIFGTFGTMMMMFLDQFLSAGI